MPLDFCSSFIYSDPCMMLCSLPFPSVKSILNWAHGPTSVKQYVSSFIPTNLVINSNGIIYVNIF